VNHGRGCAVNRGLAVAWRLGDGGTKEKGVQRDPVSGLTRARAVVCRQGDSGEVEVENELGGGSAQAQREEEKWRRRCSENRRRHLPFIGVVGWCGDAVVHE
jgi:hypothetical protein